MNSSGLWHWLSLLVWPLVAMIAGTAFVHGCRLLVECVNCSLSSYIRNQNQERTRWMNLISSISQSTLPAMVRAATHKDELRETCTRAMVAVLQAQGAFPWGPSEDGARQLVREIRKMYAELEKPTMAKVSSPDATADDGDWGQLDGEDIDQTFDATGEDLDD